MTGPSPTQFLPAPRLAAAFGLEELVFASEVGQVTGSFKFRAAWHVVSNTDHPRYIAASSGNFGQALALACQLLGRGCTIVMPTTSARVKIEAVRGFGATVDLVDTAVTPRAARVAALAAADPAAYVASPYDDPLVIAGNATLGDEIAALGGFQMVVVPVGGGGLAAGVHTGLRRSRCVAALVAAEPLLANDAARSWREGELLSCPAEAPTIADGARTLSLGRHNWDVLANGLAGVVEIDEPTIAAALALLGEVGVRCEPTGALALGALIADAGRFAGRRVCAVVSGGNVDPDVYARVLADGRARVGLVN